MRKIKLFWFAIVMGAALFISSILPLSATDFFKERRQAQALANARTADYPHLKASYDVLLMERDKILSNEHDCWSAISSGNFAEVWRLEMEEGQAQVWKEIALKKAKSKIKKLAKKYVSENEHLPTLIRATNIVQQFNGLPPYQELIALLETTTEAERARLLERNPGLEEQKAELVILRRIGQRLFEGQ